MTVKVSKPTLNIREKLSELDKPTGVKGNELLRSDTAQDARNLIGAGRKNKFINGAMRISQRGSSISTSTDADYSLDRIQHIVRGAHDSTYTQSDDHPDGFSKSLKISPNSTHTPTGSDNAGFQSFIEGQDLQDLQFGTANPKSFTVSFYAKSGSQNNGHQYTFEIRSYPSGGATTRIKTFPFVVTTTWQRFTFTFTGDGLKDIVDGSGRGFACLWNLAAGPDDITSQYTDWYELGKFMCVNGQSNFQDNTSNEFYLTGVQLEVGDEATEFEHLSWAEDLRLCQRYYQEIQGSDGTTLSYLRPLGHSGAVVEVIPDFLVPMRANPTVTFTGTIHCRACAQNTTATTITLSGSSFETPSNNVTTGHFWCAPTSGSPFTAGYSGRIKSGANGSSVNFSAEL